VTIATGDAVDTEPPPSRRREEFLIIAFIVVVLVTLTAVIWSHSAKAFDRGGAIQSGTVSGNTPRFISVEAFSGGSSTVPLHSLHLNSVKPIMAENTANASIQMLLCRPIGDFAGDASTADMSSFCSSLETFRPVAGSFFPNGTWLLVAEITPHQPGVVHIAQFNVTFREGLRTGKQRVGTDFTLTVT